MDKIEINTYNPLFGQDYFSAGNFNFTGSQEQFFVAEITGDFKSEILKSNMLKCIQATSKQAFFFIVPWYPGNKELTLILKQKFPNVSEVNGSLCCYFENVSLGLDKLFSIREMHGGIASGEWVLGGCNEQFDIPNTKTWDFGGALDQIDKIGCLLYLGEMKQTIFMSKLFEGFSEIEENLVKIIRKK